jgi:hypothetical protein
MFSSKEADKKVGSSSGTSKVIQPGNVVARIVDIKLDVPPYDSTSYNIMLNLETAPILEEGFEGLPIDKDVPELGNYKGQVARVQTQQYAYNDYTNKEGKTLKKEDAMFKWIWNFAKEIGASKDLIENDIQADSIEDYLEAAKKYLINPERYIHFCIAGSEYENKAGYTQYRLFLPKMEKGKMPYELVADGEKPSKLITFSEAVHIKKKKVSESVDSFTGRDSNNDLDLD